MNAWANLDRLAAQKAQAIITATMEQRKEDVENLCTKALGVLQEDGLYAAVLYLLSRRRVRRERPIAEAAVEHLLGLLSAEETRPLGLVYSGSPTNPQQVLAHMADSICADLNRMLLVWRLFEQTLIYARYGAMAREEEEE